MSTLQAPGVEDRPEYRARGISVPAVLHGVEHAAAFVFGVFLTLLALVTLRDFDGVWGVLGLVTAGVFIPVLAGYSFTKPLLTLRRTVTFGIIAPVGFLLPLGKSLLARGPSGNSWVELAAGVSFALICDFMVRAGILARARASEHPWLRRALPCIALVPLVSLSAIVVQDRREDHLTRMDLAMDLYGQLWEYYPHWDTSPLKPRDLWAKYRSRLVAADSVCGHSEEPCAPYLHALRDMFAELRNGHTEILVPEETGSPAIKVGSLRGDAVITHVEPRSDAEAAGLEVGDEIRAVDGVSVDEVLRRIPGWRIAFASARTRANAAYQALLEGPAGKAVRIQVARAGSPPRTVSLKRSRVRYDWETTEGETGRSELQARRGSSWNEPEYVHLDGFEGNGLEEQFDRVLDDALDSTGLILDLRDNYGGILDHAFRMLGRFFPEPLTIGEHCLPQKEGEEDRECTVHRIEPRGKVYRGRLAVLIDENVYSAGELAAYALCRSGRARCFGRTTAGETDCVFRLDLPGAVARMSWADFRPSFGPALLGAGLDPDVRVERTLEDLRGGRDPEYDAARAWLVSGRTGVGAEELATRPQVEPSERLASSPSGKLLSTEHAR